MKPSVALLLAALNAWSAGPVREKTLVVVNDVADPVSLDPHREFDASSENILSQIFDGLVRFTEDGRIEPALAESWRRVDDHTMEFRLRKGVLFHNGEPLGAEAVRFSLARQLDPARPAPNASILGKIGAEVVDGETVRLKTGTPDGVLLNKIALFFKILPPKYLAKVGDAGFAQRPVGTGPFVFDRWVARDRVELAANRSYWMSVVPKIDRLIFKFMPLEAQLPALMDGRVDMLTDLSGLDTLKVARNPGTTVIKAKDFYALILHFNVAKKPFSDARLRRAIVHAIDRKALIRYGGKGNAVALKGLTMDGQFGHHPGLPGYDFDLPLAKRLIAEAGYPKGLKIKVQAREEVKSFVKVIAAQLAKAGVQAEYYFVSQQKQFEELALPKMDPKRPPWDGDVAIAQYTDPTVHVYFPYSIFLYSKSPYSLARDEAFDELFLKMTSTLDLDEQKKIAWRLEEMAWRECWSISLVQLLRPFGLNRRVRYRPYVTGMLDFRHVSLEDGYE